MGRAIKLVLYYFAYQLAFTFLVGLPAGIIKVMNEISENDNLAYAVFKPSTIITDELLAKASEKQPL
mgnify:CR=1 FL=1